MQAHSSAKANQNVCLVRTAAHVVAARNVRETTRKNRACIILFTPPQIERVNHAFHVFQNVETETLCVSNKCCAVRRLANERHPFGINRYFSDSLFCV